MVVPNEFRGKTKNYGFDMGFNFMQSYEVWHKICANSNGSILCDFQFLSTSVHIGDKNSLALLIL